MSQSMRLVQLGARMRAETSEFLTRALKFGFTVNQAKHVLGMPTLAIFWSNYGSAWERELEGNRRVLPCRPPTPDASVLANGTGTVPATLANYVDQVERG